MLFHLLISFIISQSIVQPKVVSNHPIGLPSGGDGSGVDSVTLYKIPESPIVNKSGVSTEKEHFPKHFGNSQVHEWFQKLKQIQLGKDPEAATREVNLISNKKHGEIFNKWPKKDAYAAEWELRLSTSQPGDEEVVTKTIFRYNWGDDRMISWINKLKLQIEGSSPKPLKGKGFMGSSPSTTDAPQLTELAETITTEMNDKRGVTRIQDATAPALNYTFGFDERPSKTTELPVIKSSSELPETRITNKSDQELILIDPDDVEILKNFKNTSTPSKSSNIRVYEEQFSVEETPTNTPSNVIITAPAADINNGDLPQKTATTMDDVWKNKQLNENETDIHATQEVTTNSRLDDSFHSSLTDNFTNVSDNQDIERVSDSPTNQESYQRNSVPTSAPQELETFTSNEETIVFEEEMEQDTDSGSTTSLPNIIQLSGGALLLLYFVLKF